MMIRLKEKGTTLT
jgi:hypothetical protein